MCKCFKNVYNFFNYYIIYMLVILLGQGPQWK